MNVTYVTRNQVANVSRPCYDHRMMITETTRPFDFCEYEHGTLRVRTWTHQAIGKPAETDIEIWQDGQYIETITI